MFRPLGLRRWFTTITPRHATVSERGLKAIRSSDLLEKQKITRETIAGYWANEIKMGTLDPSSLPLVPGKPERPPWLDKTPDQPSSGLTMNLYIMQNLCHIELTAVNSYWDTVLRFQHENLPAEFYHDFLSVVDDEARHFDMVFHRLQELQCGYGVMPFSSTLWDHCIDTKDCILARLAIIPLVQEARGLDAGPRFAQRLRSSDDSVSADIVAKIAEEEIGHVSLGMKWFVHICKERCLDPKTEFHRIVKQHMPLGLFPPFNTEAREQAEFPIDWYEPLTTTLKPPQKKEKEEKEKQREKDGKEKKKKEKGEMGRVKKEKRSKKLQQKELWEREMRRREEDRKNTEACASTSSRSVHDNARKEWNLRTNTFPSSDTRSFSSPSSSSSSSSSSPSSSSSSSPCLRVSSSSTVHRRHLSLQTQSLRHYHPTMNHCNYQPISHTQAHAASQRPRAVFITPVWPSQSNTAAGVRTWSLFQILQELCYGVVCMSAARPDEKLQSLLLAKGVETISVSVNDDAFNARIQALDPTIVVYDRFTMEEQFGWRVKESCPNALTVLDTQDLHFLRFSRERRERSRKREEMEQAKLLKRNNRKAQHDTQEVQHQYSRYREMYKYACISALDVMDASKAPVDVFRELSSIHKSDLTLVTSPAERSLLEHWFNIPGDKIVLAPFYFHDHQINPFPKDLDARRHFVTIGNFRHSPNEDSVFWLKERIWPKIKTEMKKRLNEKINSRDGQDRDESTHVDYSNIECHVYGAFPAKKHMNLTNKKEGFIVKGYLPGNTQYETLSNYRALIAPLRFGAGLKGKVADSWSVGTPVITTSIGAEGMGLGARNNDAAKTKDDVHLGSHFGARTPSQLLSQPSPQPETPPVTPAVGAFGGCISDDEDEFAMHACDVYTDANLFRSVQEKGFRAVRNEFDYHHHADILKNKITELLAVEDNSSSTTPKENATYLRKRRSDWTSNLLACESMRSTYYLSKFIQLKENTRDFCEKE